MEREPGTVVLNNDGGPGSPSIDIVGPLAIQVDHDKKTLWVNVDGVCRLRLNRIEDTEMDLAMATKGTEFFVHADMDDAGGVAVQLNVGNTRGALAFMYGILHAMKVSGESADDPIVVAFCESVIKSMEFLGLTKQDNGDAERASTGSNPT